ncbi:MAG TPA: hypothetical protein VF676_02015 [Flavobacterium sp.]|jgi:hypothetical protein
MFPIIEKAADEVAFFVTKRKREKGKGQRAKGKGISVNFKGGLDQMSPYALRQDKKQREI